MKFYPRIFFIGLPQKNAIVSFLAVCVVLAVTALHGSGQVSNPKNAGQKDNSSISEAVRLLQNNQPDEAEEVIRKFLKTSPGNVEAKTLLGVILDQKGSVADAEKEYLSVLKLNPKSVPALANLGILLAKTNRRDEAVKVLEKVLNLQPTHQQAAYNLAVIYSSQNEYQKALPLLENIVGITATDQTPKIKDNSLLLTLAKSYAATGNTKKIKRFN